MTNFSRNVGVDLDDANDIRRSGAGDITKSDAATRKGIVDANGDELVASGSVQPHELAILKEAHPRILPTHADLRAALNVGRSRRHESHHGQRWVVAFVPHHGPLPTAT